MKKFNVREMLNKMMVRRRYLIVNELDVTFVLDTVQRHATMEAVLDLQTGRCGWAWDRNKWFVYFNISDEKWTNIAIELSKYYTLEIKDGTGNIFVNRKGSWS